MKFREQLESLYGGVSQQSPVIRLPSQCETLENAQVTIERGLEKRPPSELVKVLSSSNIASDSHIHRINRDSTEKYLVVFTKDSTNPIEVYDRSGDSYPVVYSGSSAKSYVQTTDPREYLRALTVADYTIIANRNITTAMSSTVDAAATPFALVWIKTGYNGSYSLLLNSTNVTEATSSAETTAIATALTTNIEAADGGSTWQVTRCPDDNITAASVLRIERVDGADFTISGSDPLGDAGMVVGKDYVDDLTDLPPCAGDQDILRVRDDKTGAGVSLYFKYNLTEKTWEETRAPGVAYSFDATTLPHQMTRLQDDGAGTVTGTPDQIYFSVATISWTDKLVGDLDTMPVPGVIGEKVQDILWYKDRFGILTTNGILLSRTSDYWNFWGTTGQEQLDNDPIDLAANTSDVVSLRYAVPFADSLLLFGLKQQFSLTSANGPLSPISAILDPTTDIQLYESVRPSKAGPNVYFAGPNRGYCQVREYFVEPDTLLNDAADVTAHVSRYVDDNPRALISDVNGDTLYLLGPEGSSTVWVYQYYWQGQEKPQSAWGKWIFDDEVVGLTIFESALFVILKSGSEVRIEKLSENPDHLTSTPFVFHLDRLSHPTSLVQNGDWIEVTMPYVVDGTEELIETTSGLKVEATEYLSSYVLRFPYDSSWSLTAADYYAGKPYDFTFGLSEWLPQEGERRATDGAIQCLHIEAMYEDTGYLKFTGTAPHRGTTIQEFSPNVADLTLDSAVVSDGTKRFQVNLPSRKATLEISSDKHYPVRITSIGRYGDFRSRQRR